MENKVLVTSGERQGGRGKVRIGDKRYKLLYIKQIHYNDISYSTGNITNIL